jgi:small subunit ribosomal protein S16
MLKVKLARFGKKNQPHYRIVVNEARDKRDGSYVALIGHYAPTQTPKLLEINLEEYNKWIGQGAQPTDTVASLVERFKSGDPFPAKKNQLSKKAKAKLAEKKEVKAEAKTEVQEKPAEEVKEETPAPEVKTEEVPSGAQSQA